MQHLEIFLKEHQNFPRSRHIQGRSSIADIFSKKNRCGIYVLGFENGDVYAGQAKDVTRRYVQHSKNHDDITHITFKRMAKSKLNDEERSVIWALEKQGFTLRNITFTSLPKGESDFELVMSDVEQDDWLKERHEPMSEGTKVQDDTLRQKYQKRFAKFVTKPYAEESIDFLRRYVQLGLPVPLKSEMAFWSVSCLPSFRSGKVTVYSRVNVNWQEVLAVYTVDDVLCFSFQLARSPLQEVYGESLKLLRKKHAGLHVDDDHFYEPGGHDQVNIGIEGFDTACRVLADPAVKKAIRLFNLRLMKKGPCVFSRYHCMDLADRLLETKPIEFDTRNGTERSTGLGKLLRNFSQKLQQW